MIRLGFLGTGWIGRNRLEAILAGGKATAVAIHDPDPEAAGEARKIVRMAREVESIEGMLSLDLDGLVIATPSAMHADQCVRALGAGIAVFCQKPLGRNATEVAAVIAAAKSADRLLGVDLSYRHIAGIEGIRSRIRRGELGQVFAADLTFHNAYGPGAGWFWDPCLSGGGCLIDLGVHLVDLALWMFDFPEVTSVSATLLRDGHPRMDGEVEDYAIGEFALQGGVNVRISCSWNLNAGQDALIEATFYGTKGGARLRNENGSFFDFSADLFTGRSAERIASPPDDWGGRAAVEWVQKLAQGEKFAESTTGLLQTAETLDRLYGRPLAYQPFTRSHVSMISAAPSVT
ncbi:MAG TPA: Gfo/Idh/MocA family oxidoreductase [Sphingomicrobium sp.]|nr:Gfo/Idh/MocA family oxidoreductase [Sphingomicrobium sp.]